MKSPIIAAAAILLIIAIALAGCALFSETDAGKPLASREFRRVGEVMFHIDAKQDLQDESGKAVVPESPRERGFSELCYVGLNAAMQPMFRRRDVDFVTGQTPGHRKVVWEAPEKTAEFTLDYSKGRYIPMRDRTIEIIEATPAGVTFTVQ